MVARFRVVEVRSADGAPAPPEVAERFARRCCAAGEISSPAVQIIRIRAAATEILELNGSVAKLSWTMACNWFIPT